MNDSGVRGLVIGIAAMSVAVSVFLIGQMKSKEPEKVEFRALPEKTSTYTSEAEASATTAKHSAAAKTEIVTESVTEPLLVNINKADTSELCRLDGIGESRASAIAEYREKYGDFHNIEEIMDVNGIGEEIFAAIRGNIYVDSPTYPESGTVTEPVTTSAERVTEASVADAPELEDVVPININEADEELLMLLPYVDEETAEAIIRLREDIGGYSHPYELLYIDNLTQKQVAEIVGFVTVGQ